MDKSESAFHSFDDNKSSGIFPSLLISVIIFILLGVGTGYILSLFLTKPSTLGLGSKTASVQSNTSVEKGKVYGTTDTSTFKDVAEGVMKTGGINGEGQYHLERPGGDSQNVYMTSSIVDLSQFVNHKVKVHGATQASKHAGWLMDVGQVGVLE